MTQDADAVVTLHLLWGLDTYDLSRSLIGVFSSHAAALREAVSLNKSQWWGWDISTEPLRIDGGES